MRTVEQKWRTNMDKVSFARNFPGRLKNWDECLGRKVRIVVPLVASIGTTVILFDDRSFIIAHGGAEPAGADVIRAIEALRPHLGAEQAEAYAELDELAASDRELTRRARLENILGAIRTNIGNIPELHDEIPGLLARLRGESAGAATDAASPVDGIEPSPSSAPNAAGGSSPASDSSAPTSGG